MSSKANSVTPIIANPRIFWLVLAAVVFAPSLVERVLVRFDLIAPPTSVKEVRVTTPESRRIEDKVDLLLYNFGVLYEDEWNGTMERAAQRQLLMAIKANSELQIPYEQLPDVREIQRTHRKELRLEPGSVP